jgi:hypothetical protein
LDYPVTEFRNLNYFFLVGNRVVYSTVRVYLIVKENAGMPKHYRIMMDYAYQEKKEGNLLDEIYSPHNLYII